MIRIVIIAVHPQESQILQMAFRQRSFAVFASQPVTGNFLQMLQYRPDYVFIEIPPTYQEQIALMRLLGKNERFRMTPVIAYGSFADNTVKNDITAAGCKYFVDRPLKLNHLFEAMKKTAPDKDLEVDAKRAKQTKTEEKTGDLQRLLDPREDVRVKIDLMVKHTGKLMSFPFAIAKILEIADDPNRGAEDLAKVISGDLSLCTTILKVSNSVFFATRGKEIRSAKEAIMRIGFSEVKTIAIGLELMSLFPDKDTFGFNHMDFWIYALGRAQITEKLARHVRYPDPAFAFLAGLLSDFSVLMLDAFFTTVFDTILQKIASEDMSYSEASDAVLGFQPMEFVVRLLEIWRL
jgi:ActR/RegA family two-component response regulator